MIRKWYVYATPASGGNKVVKGPFNNPYEAAAFIDRERPMQAWKGVVIYSKLTKAI